MKNKFIIISTCYNKGKWVKNNVNSLKSQSNQNFKVYYGYDESTDNTLEHLKEAIGKDTDQYQIIHNKGEKSFLGNFIYVYNYLKNNNLINKEDIIVEIDGDDWLLHSFVLDSIEKEYKNPKTLMTYGQYIEYPKGNVGNHFYMHLDDEVDRTNSYRKSNFPYSHLRTYKAWLLDKLTDKDLINPKTGKYFGITGDWALCMPLVELVGKKHIKRIDQPVYVLNRHDDLQNESKTDEAWQKECETIIRSMPPKERLIMDTPTNKKITTLIGSCDSYSPLWKNFDILYNKYWGLNTHNILVSETINKLETPFLKDYQVLTDGTGLKWGERMLKSLDHIKTPYVFFILDDYYFTQPLTEDFINSKIELMGKYNANKIVFDVLTPEYGLIELEKDKLYQFKMSSEYLNSVQPAIWEVDYLKKVLKAEYSPWDFEVAGNDWASQQNGIILLDRLDPPTSGNITIQNKSIKHRFYHNFVRVGGKISEGWEELYRKENLN